MPGEKVSAVMFCKQFLAYAVHIDWCYHSIHKHSSRSQHAPYDDMGMHRRLFEGRHLVYSIIRRILLDILFCVIESNVPSTAK